MIQKSITGFVFALLLAVGFGNSSEAKAQYWENYYGGTVVGWGWYGPGVIVSWPVYGWPVYGYYYGPYWHYYPRYQTYAAISYSKSTNRYGVAWGNSTRDKALSEANGYCNEKDCQPVVWVQGGCAAISAGEKGTGMGWAYHAERSVAENYARHACNRGRPKDAKAADPKYVCKQQAWVCSY